MSKRVMMTQIKVVALILIMVSVASDPAAAISTGLAKKCRQMALNAHPPQRAGSKSGYAEAERIYFRDCVAKGGKMPSDDAPSTGKK
jgi:hypothetical protein